MPYVNGTFVRVANSFSEPVDDTVVEPADANALFNDYDGGLTQVYAIASVNAGAPVSFDTVALATAATIPADVDVLRVNGWATIGDYLGSMAYERKVSEPSVPVPYKFQTVGGVWWQAINLVPRPAIPNVHRIAAMGDSITDRGKGTGTRAVFSDPQGFTQWLPFLTYQRAELPTTMNFGVSGSTAQEGISQIPNVIASNPWACIVEFGTNGLVDFFPAQTCAALEEIYTQLEKVGIIVFAIPILGRTGIHTLNQPYRDRAMQINAWIRARSYLRRGLYVVDCGPTFDDPTSLTFAPKSGLTSDDIHPNYRGAYLIAQQLATLVNGLLPYPFQPLQHPADIYTTDSPQGNLLPNGMMLGSSGNVDIGSGVVPDYWSLTGDLGGATLVASKSTMADGERECTQLVISGNYNSTLAYVDLSTNVQVPANISSGDTIQADANIEVSAVAASIRGVSCFTSTIEAGQTYTYEDGRPTLDTFECPFVAYSGLLRTPARTTVAVPSVAQVFIRVYFVNVSGSTAVSLTLKVGSVSLRKKFTS